MNRAEKILKNFGKKDEATDRSKFISLIGKALRASNDFDVKPLPGGSFKVMIGRDSIQVNLG